MVGRTYDIPWGVGTLLTGVTLVAVLVAAMLTATSADPWYAALAKPALAPPGLFSLMIWGVLFLLMGAGVLLVAYEAGDWRYTVSPAGLYITALALHLAWRLSAFGFHEVAVGLVILLAVWISVFALLQDFARYSPLAAWLQIPQLVWLAFETYCQAFIWLANRGS